MSFALTVESFPSPDGPLRWTHVPWDSELFGFPVYELRTPDAPAAQLDAWLAERSAAGACLVWCKVPLAGVAGARTLVTRGFYPVETMVDLYRRLDGFTPLIERHEPALRLRPAGEHDLPAIVELGGNAFRLDRFHLDPYLPSERADERFRQWVRRGFAAGEPVFVYEDVRRPALLGFFHVRAGEQQSVDLSLAAVQPAYRAAGIGVLMYQAVLAECRARGYRSAFTRVSVANLDVLNTFIRLGFTARRPVVTLHWTGPSMSVR
jgi:ribosomal protein S18 acetylase RimI-like enzyme